MSWYFALPLYWLIVFVICFVVSEYSQKYLYDETTPNLGLKLAAGTFILAALLTTFRSSYDTMFTAAIHWSLLQGIVWFLVFMFIFRFHPKHALSLGVATFLLAGGLATLGIDSLSGNAPTGFTPEIRKPNKPLRRKATTFGPITPEKDAKAAGEAAPKAGNDENNVPKAQP
jgi:hypothetical protein